MKRIIDRKVYNTDTAECLHSWDNGIRENDFRSMDESLYRTKKGQLFMYGSGGPMTKYAESCGNNSTSGSSNIWLVDKNEAMDWLESHEGEDALLKHFKKEIAEG